MFCFLFYFGHDIEKVYVKQINSYPTCPKKLLLRNEIWNTWYLDIINIILKAGLNLYLYN